MDAHGAPETRYKIDAIAGPKARSKFSDLLDRSFLAQAGSHYLEDFPIWDEVFMSDPERIVRLGAYQDERLVSCAGARMADIKTPGGPLRIALIGAVATEPQCRGRGLASELVLKTLGWATARGACLALLWGSEHSLYRRLGFEVCGRQVRVPLSDLPFAASGMAVERGWTDALFECLKHRPDGLAFDASDLAWIRAHRNVDWFWLGNPKSPAAYAAVGRGIDLHNLVHEWGGEPQSLLALLTGVRKFYPEAALLSAPHLLREIQVPFDESAAESLCLARILDPPRLFSSYFPGRELRVEQRPEGWKVDLETRQGPAGLTGLSDSGLTRLFLGNAADPTPEPRGALPIPLWIWGLDSV